MSFGYKTAWFAVRTADAAAVMRALSLTGARPTTAAAGIAAGYGEGSPGLMSGKAFVSAPLEGWTLAMSTGFFPIADAPAQLPDLLARLSAELGTEAQFFCTHRVVEAHLWARAIGGKTIRAYSYVGESGQKLVDLGPPTPEEVALGLRFFDPESPESKDDAYWEREDLRRPDEEDVMSVAGKWSVNPAELTEIADGLLADLPASPVAAPPEPARPPKKPWWQFW